MARQSVIHDHPERSNIEADLCSGMMSKASIARKYSLTEFQIVRHWQKMPSSMKAKITTKTMRTAENLEALKAEERNNLLFSLKHQRLRLLKAQDMAEDREDYLGVGKLATPILKNSELVANYLGELHRNTTETKINICITAEYLELRRAIISAVKDYPEARRAIVEAIQGIEGRSLGQVEQVAAIEHQPATV